MSSKNIQKQEISTILELIVEQSETILSYSDGQIPQIELDIALENIRKLYNNFTILDKINALIVDRVTKNMVNEMIPEKVVKKESMEPIAEFNVFIEPENLVVETIIETTQVDEEKVEIVEVLVEPIPQSAEVVEIENVEIILPIADEKPTEVQVEEIIPETAAVIEEKEDAPLIDVLPEPIEEPKHVSEVAPVLPIAEPVIVKQTKQEKAQKQSSGNLFDSPAPSIADAYKDSRNSLHEKIGSNKSDNSLASKLQQKPIADLVKSIGINDKFLLIKELFNNNGEEYNEAIQLLNNFSTIMQAFDYLDVLKSKYNWDESSDASLKLFDLIRRKYQQ